MTDLPVDHKETFTAWCLNPSRPEQEELESWLLFHGYKFADRIWIERDPVIKYGFFEEFKVFLNGFLIGEIEPSTVKSFSTQCLIEGVLDDLTINYNYKY